MLVLRDGMRVDGLPEELEGLRANGVESTLLDAIDDPLALATAAFHLRALDARGALLRCVVRGDERVAALEPASPYFSYAPCEIGGEAYVVSRFAYVRIADGRALIESPLACARVVAHDASVLGLLHSLAQPRTIEDHERLLVSLLCSAGIVRRADAIEDDALRTWEFHDLLFHARSRQGRHDGRAGATFRFAGELPVPPALEPLSGDAIALPLSDIEALHRDDRPFAAVQDERRSIRVYGAPITVAQLGELLYRAARVTEQGTVTAPVTLDVARRPYPSAGGLYELDLYAAVQACDGLPPGLYRYDGAAHRLLVVPAAGEDTAALLADAARGAGIDAAAVQVLLIVSARVPRVAWKYESMAYAAVLKDAGVLLQTLYLAATAMRLAPCAVGSGDFERFARATGTSLYERTSVAEFLVGSRRADKLQR